MENTQNSSSNSESDHNSSENHQDEQTESQAETNRQIAKLQSEMSEIKSLLATLWQQVTSLSIRGRVRFSCVEFTHPGADQHVCFLFSSLSPIDTFV